MGCAGVGCDGFGCAGVGCDGFGCDGFGCDGGGGVFDVPPGTGIERIVRYAVRAASARCSAAALRDSARARRRDACAASPITSIASASSPSSAA